jgi:DNA repair exonuclease SbcCD nuclease subunit
LASGGPDRQGLSSESMSIRFIHTADWQLGMTRQFLSSEAQPRFAQARIDAIRTIGRAAHEAGAAFVVVAGDVFESNQVDPRTVRRALEALSEIPTPVFLLPGNHDPLDASSVYRSATFERQGPANVVLLDDMSPREVAPGVEVVGAPWSSKRPLCDLVTPAAAELEPKPGIKRVLVAHGVIRDTLSGDNPAAIDVGKVEEALADGRVAYVALGDRHSTTTLGASGRIYYSGTPEPTSHDESDAGNVLVVELTDGGECAVQTRPVGTWRFAQADFELDVHARVESLSRWLEVQASKERCAARVELRGTISLTVDAELQDVLTRHRDLYAALEVVAPPDILVVRPDDDDFADLQLTGFATEAVRELRAEAAAPGPQSAAARDALSLLVRLARGAGVRA